MSAAERRVWVLHTTDKEGRDEYRVAPFEMDYVNDASKYHKALAEKFKDSAVYHDYIIALRQAHQFGAAVKVLNYRGCVYPQLCVHDRICRLGGAGWKCIECGILMQGTVEVAE